jgi:REP element-mobilizing transposase RayT
MVVIRPRSPADPMNLRDPILDGPRTWRRSHAMRLEGLNSGPGIAAVTMVAAERRAVLGPPRDIGGALEEDLGHGSRDGHARILVACAMPDHLHLMVELDGGGLPLWQYVNVWKGLWTRRLALPHERPFWQRTFYDHWMRHGEALEYALYIIANPVRRGLVSEWPQWPWTRVYIPLP